MARLRWPRTVVALALGVTALAACGGGDGGAPPAARPPDATRFIGDLADGPATVSGIAAGPVTVCVEDTNRCAPVRSDGTFVLDAAVGGTVALVFSAPDFQARLVLDGVSPGATVRITGIRCSVISGTCSAEGVQIDDPAANAAPICDAAVARPATVWPPNHKLRAVAVAGVVDPDGDRVEILIDEVFQDEAVDEPGDGAGSTAPDAALNPLAVRAERAGQGDGRVYQIPFVASDGRGGMCSGIVEVCVPHDRGRGDACVDSGAEFDSLQN